MGQANPLWPVESRFPTLKVDIRKDVLVVGGGITGVSCAIHLKRAGYDVALIERNEIGGPATGASSGVLYYGSGTNFEPAIKMFGEDTATRLWKETACTIEQIVSQGKEVGSDSGLRTCGSVMLAKTEAELKMLQSEFAAVRKVGIPARLLSSAEVRDSYPLRSFMGGLAFDGVAQIHPAKLAVGAARQAGVEIYEGTSLLSWMEEGDKLAVKTEEVKVTCKELVLATNKEPFFGLERWFDRESSVVLASKPMERTKEVFPAEKIYWTMEERYDMLYPREDRLMLELYALGDEMEKMAYYFPGVDFQLEKWWGETWAKPRDYVPLVGKVSSHITVATGMGDQGIVMGWLSGQKIPMVLQGKEDWYTRMASPKEVCHFGTNCRASGGRLQGGHSSAVRKGRGRSRNTPWEDEDSQGRKSRSCRCERRRFLLRPPERLHACRGSPWQGKTEGFRRPVPLPWVQIRLQNGSCRGAPCQDA